MILMRGASLGLHQKPMPYYPPIHRRGPPELARSGPEWPCVRSHHRPWSSNQAHLAVGAQGRGLRLEMRPQLRLHAVDVSLRQTDGTRQGDLIVFAPVIDGEMPGWCIRHEPPVRIRERPRRPQEQMVRQASPPGIQLVRRHVNKQTRLINQHNGVGRHGDPRERGSTGSRLHVVAVSTECVNVEGALKNIRPPSLINSGLEQRCLVPDVAEQRGHG
jgi:hypothetical protein